MNNDWLHNVRGRMSQYEIDEPADLWARINGEARTPVAVPPQRSLWLKRYAAVAAVLVAAVSAGVFLLDFEAEKNVVPVIARLSAPVPPHGAPRDGITEDADPVVQPHMIAAAAMPDIGVPTQEESAEPDAPADTAAVPTPAQAQADTSVHRIPTTPYSGSNDARHYNHMAIAGRAGGNHKIDVSLFASGSSGISSRSNSFLAANVNMSNSSDIVYWAEDPGLGMYMNNQGRQVHHEVRHRVPIRAGVSVAYSFGSRISVVSGLNYTNLTSDIIDGSDSYYYTAEQSLHYIGLPLRLRYRVFSQWKLHTYISAGTLVEKCVSARLDKQYHMADAGQSHAAESLEHPWQFSANASVGLQCNITGLISIYAEPGLSYYFKNGSTLKTIYRDKPLNFNLDFGVRFSFGVK